MVEARVFQTVIRVIDIAPVHGLVASPYKAAYVRAKHGLLGMTKTLALEASEGCSDVTAHAACPPYVRTLLVEQQIRSRAHTHPMDAGWLAS